MAFDPRLTQYLASLEYAVNQYTADLANAEADVTYAQRRRDQCASNLERARSLLDYEREKGGMELRLIDSAYANLSVREAALKVLQTARGPIGSKEIIKTLEDAGFDFHSRYPGRSLHAALIGVDMVTKLPDGRLELIEFKSRPSSPANESSDEALELERSRMS